MACISSKPAQSNGAHCFHFDERQCGSDEFAANYELSASLEDRIVFIKAFLEEQKIRVDTIVVIPDYHEVVCEACDICPEPHRFRVRSDSAGLQKAKTLDLLNFNAEECGDL